MVRNLLRVLAALLILVVIGAAGFRLWAGLRETEPAAAEGWNGRHAMAAGLAIAYREWGPPDGPPLLLVPGTMAWSQTFGDIAEPLGKRGFRVIALDLPPFGYSQRPAAHDYSRAAQARRILAFADAIGLDRFALGVHSYGGGAALEAAFSAPERIDAMVLLDVALGLGRPVEGPPLAPLLSVGALREALVALTFSNPLATGFGLRDFIHDDRIVTGDRIALYTRPLGVAGTTHAVGRWLLTGLFADESASLAADPARYRAFAAPVLVVWGREDTVTPLGQGEEIAALLPNARLAVLEGVNHIPHVENPVEVVRLISEFLAATRGGATSHGADFENWEVRAGG